MRFTYEEFEQKAKDSGYYDQFSSYDLKLAQERPEFGMSALSYKQQYAEAKNQAEKDAAHAGLEKLRREYGGYSGGTDGGQYYKTGLSPKDYQSQYTGQMEETVGKLNNYGDFQYDKEKPTYQSQHKGQADKLVNQMNHYGSFEYEKEKPEYRDAYRQELAELLQRIKSYGAFEYDTNSDPSYAAYAKQYRREGERAGQQALAQASAMTGGQLSSAAMTAASQAGDYYASRLTDQIPALVEAAYGRYVNEYNMLNNQLSQTRNAQQTEYNRYLNDLSQYNTDRAQSYNEWQDGYNMLQNNLSAVQSQEQMAYNQYLNELSQYNTDRAQSYSQWQDGYNRLQNNLSTMQSLGNQSYDHWLDQINYNAQQDAIAREQAEREKQWAENERQWAWKEQQAQAEAAQNERVLARAQVDAILAAGARPDDELITQSEYSEQYIDTMWSHYQSLYGGV